MQAGNAARATPNYIVVRCGLWTIFGIHGAVRIWKRNNWFFFKSFPTKTVAKDYVKLTESFNNLAVCVVQQWMADIEEKGNGLCSTDFVDPFVASSVSEHGAWFSQSHYGSSVARSGSLTDGFGSSSSSFENRLSNSITHCREAAESGNATRFPKFCVCSR